MTEHDDAQKEPFKGWPKFNWHPLRRAAFHYDSIGFHAFPHGLEGRSRPEGLLAMPVRKDSLLEEYFGEKKVKVATIADLLNLKAGLFEEESTLEEIILEQSLRRSEEYAFAKLSELPHFRVFKALFSTISYGALVPPEDEDPIIVGVETALDTVKNQDVRKALIDHFGLKSGKEKSFRHIALANGVEVRDVQIAITEALLELRQNPFVKEMLSPYARLRL